jgi:hypothetical protein
MKSLAAAFNELFKRAGKAFPQQRTAQRAWWLAIGTIAGGGKKTIGGAIRTCLQQFEDWSAKYRVFSRSPWEPRDLFQPALEYCLSLGRELPFMVALDDTGLKKTGKHIPRAGYQRDPGSPPFHVNLRWGQRYIQASALIRPEGLCGPARAVPIRFEPAPPPRKPKKKSKPEEIAACRQAMKTENLSCQGANLIREIRSRIPADRPVLFAMDGSYCNGNVLKHLPAGVEVIARTRKDIRLSALPEEAQGSHAGRKRQYGEDLPTPEELRQNEAVPWQRAQIYGAGKMHDLKYKSLEPVLWRKGAGTRPLRLFVIAPLGYRKNKHTRVYYREPAYLLSTDLRSPVSVLIQAAFDRWEIEVNHREEKDLMGVGKAQVRSDKSAARVPQFVVCLYSFLLVASLKAFGPKRTEDYPALPKWRKAESVRRPSITDIVARFKQEMMMSAMEEISFLQKNPGQKLVGCMKKRRRTTAEKSIARRLVAAFCASPSG